MPKTTLRVKASEYGEQQLEALNLASRLELELNDGSVVEVIHPWLWNDATEAAVKAVNDDDSADKPYNFRYAMAVLGAKEHARFIKAGGQSSQIALAVAMLKRGDVPSGEDGSNGSDPKGKSS
jgi:hypothetical protein